MDEIFPAQEGTCADASTRVLRRTIITATPTPRLNEVKETSDVVPNDSTLQPRDQVAANQATRREIQAGSHQDPGNREKQLASTKAPRAP